MSSDEKDPSTVTGEQLYNEYLNKSKRSPTKILKWHRENVYKDMEDNGFQGPAVEEALDYWESLQAPGSQAGPSGSAGAGLVTVTVEYKTGEKKTFANLESNMHVETLKSRILQERRLHLPTSYVLLTKSGLASQIDPTRTLAEESLDHFVILADILVSGVIPKIPMSEIINRIRTGNYSSWGEARGIPVEVKEARGEANKGKWNDDFGQDFCAISNFVSVRWFDGEWQPGYFIMGITDNGTVQGFTYNQADNLMQSTQSALRNYLSPNDHVRLRVEQVGETFIVLAEIPPTIRMCSWRAIL